MHCITVACCRSSHTRDEEVLEITPIRSIPVLDDQHLELDDWPSGGSLSLVNRKAEMKKAPETADVDPFLLDDETPMHAVHDECSSEMCACDGTTKKKCEKICCSQNAESAVEEVLDIAPIRALPVLDDKWTSGYRAEETTDHHRDFEMSPSDMWAFENVTANDYCRVYPSSPSYTRNLSEHVKALDAFGNLMTRYRETNPSQQPFPTRDSERHWSKLKPFPVSNSSTSDWPWAPDHELVMHGPKKMCPSQALQKGKQQVQVVESRSRSAPPYERHSMPQVDDPEEDDEADLDARMQTVLENAKKFDTARLRSKSDGHGDDDETNFQSWCHHNGLDHFAFYSDYSKARKEKKKKEHHHHGTTKVEPEPHKVFKRPALTDPRPQAVRKDYGQAVDAPGMWKSHRPKDPRKGDLIHNAEYQQWKEQRLPPQPRTYNF